MIETFFKLLRFLLAPPWTTRKCRYWQRCKLYPCRKDPDDCQDEDKVAGYCGWHKNFAEEDFKKKQNAKKTKGK